MIRALKSSWWVHLPGLLAIMAMLAILAARWPWPARVPVHFNFYMQPDRWGSPWEFSIFPLLAAWIVIAGMIGSAIWARQEKGRKRFNLTLPLIVAPLGAVAGVHLWYWCHLSILATIGHAPHGWTWIAISALAVAAASIVLETFRKAIPEESENDVAAKKGLASHP